MNKKSLFAKNSFSGVIQKILIAILTFITIPLFIRLLGAELFGVFAIISTIGDLTRLTNVGFHIALIKFLSFQGKTKESSQDVMVAFISMLGIMILFVVFLLVFSDFIILQIFNVSPEHFPSAKFLFICLVFANAFLFLGMPFSATLESLRLIYKTNILQFVYSIIYWSLILLFVSLGGGLQLIGVAILAAAVVWFLLTLVLAIRAWGYFELKGIKAYFIISVKKQLGYGLKVYLSGLLGLFTEPLIKILISNFFGVTYVGFVDIGLRIRNQITRIFKASVWPLFQYFSEMPDKERAAFLVKDVQEKLIVGLIPITVILLFASNALVTLWIGENVEVITNTLLVITIGSLLGSLTMEPISIYLIAYHPLRLFFNQIFMITAILLPLFFLQKALGFTAVYVSFILSYVVSFIHMMYCQRIFLHNMIFNDKKRFLKFVVYVLLLLIVGFLLFIINFPPQAILFITPLFILLLAYFLIRELKIITKKDIIFYLDKNLYITKSLVKLLK